MDSLGYFARTTLSSISVVLRRCFFHEREAQGETEKARRVEIYNLLGRKAEQLREHKILGRIAVYSVVIKSLGETTVSLSLNTDSRSKVKQVLSFLPRLDKKRFTIHSAHVPALLPSRFESICPRHTNITCLRSRSRVSRDVPLRFATMPLVCHRRWHLQQKAKHRLVSQVISRRGFGGIEISISCSRREGVFSRELLTRD